MSHYYLVKGYVSRLRPVLAAGAVYGDCGSRVGVDMEPVTVRSGEYTNPEEFLEKVRAAYKEYGYVFHQVGSVTRSNA